MPARPPITALFRPALPLAMLACVLGAHASPISDSLEQLTQGQRFERRISLSTLGLLGPSINVPPGSLQEFYFPAHGSDDARALLVSVPRNQPGASFAVNGVPVSPSTVATKGGANHDAHGSSPTTASRFPLNGQATETRLGMQAGAMPQDGCTAVADSGVALNPNSHLSYYPSAQSTAAARMRGAVALPDRPFLLVAAPPLSSQTFDTAWRVGVAMSQQGRPAIVHTLPAVGDTVDTRTLSIPPGLASIPAFAALGDAKERHAISNAAEIGALLMLDAPGLLADVVVVDPALQGQIGDALDALGTQITDPDARSLFTQWRDSSMPLARKGLAATSGTTIIRSRLGAHPVWAVPATGAAGPDLPGGGAGWQRLSATANGAARTAAHQASHPIVRWSGDTAREQYIVEAPQSWSATFAMLPPTASSHTPSRIEVGFTLPAGSAVRQPVGVLHWNGVLLAARQLKATDGRRQVLAADIPVYALSALNLLQVSLEQDAPAGDCRTMQPAPSGPATTLDLDVRFRAAAPKELPRNATFADLIPALGFDAEMAVPQAFLGSPREGLSTAIHLAAAANLSPGAARLVLVQDGTSYVPTRPFIAAGVAMQDARAQVTLADQEIRFRDHPIAGLPWEAPERRQVSVMQVVRTAGQTGLQWYPLGNDAWPGATGLLVNHASLALLGPGAEVAWISGSGALVHASDANHAGPMYEWRSLFSWGVPVTLGLLALFIALLVASVIATRIAERRKSAASEGTP